MAFTGIGGGVNLGSATARLFVDGSGMRRGLNTASGALDNYAAKAKARAAAVAAEAVRVSQAAADSAARIATAQAKSNAKIVDAESRRIRNVDKVKTAQAEKVAKATVAATQAANQASKTAVLNDPATQKRVADLSTKVADANANATRIIAEGYRQREAALKALTGTTARETQKQIDAQNRLNVATQRQKDLLKKRDDLQKQIAKSTVPDERSKLGASLGGTSSALKKADAEVAAARLNLTKIDADVKKSLDSMSKSSSDAIRKSLDDEKRAVNESRKAIGQQAKEFERLGGIAGKSGVAAANAIKKTGQELVKNADNFHKINTKIARQQEKTSSTTGVAQLKSLELEKQLMGQRVAALDKLRNSQVAYEQSVTSFSQTISGVASKDAAAAAAAADVVVAAKATEAKLVAEVQAAENANVTRVKADETAKIIELQAAEAKKVTQIKEAEAAKVVEAQNAENLALENVTGNALGSVLGAATFATVALGAAVAGTVSQFASFDEALHNIASISKDTNFVFDEMRNKIEDLAVARGQGPTELASALYDIVSSGFQAEEALTILDASSKAAVAGMTDVAKAGKSITAVINAYKNAAGDLALTWKDAQKVSDIAFAAVREGVFTFEELTAQQGDNLSIAAELNVSYAELAASYVVLTRAGNSLSESTTQINGIMRTFLKPNEELASAIDRYGESVLHVTGLTGAALVKQFGFGAALQFVAEATDGDTAALGRLFPNVRALRGEIGLGGRNLAEYNHQLSLMKSASLGVGATQHAFAIQQKSVSFQLRQVREELRIAAIEMGEHFAPGVLLAAKAAGEAASAFASLPDPIQAVIGGMGGFAFAVSGSVLVIGNLVKAVVSGREGIQAMTTAIKANTKAMAVWRIATNPAVIALVALAFITYKLIQSNRAHKKSVQELKKEYENLAVALDQLQKRPDINAREAAGLVDVSKSVQDVVDTSKELNKEFDKVALKGGIAEPFIVGFDEAGNAITRTVDSFREFQDLRESMTLTPDEEKTLTVDLSTIITTPELDVDFVVSEFERLSAEFHSGTITADEYAAAIHDMAIGSDELTKTARAAAAGEVELGKSLRNVGEFFGTDEDRADEFRKGLQGLIDEASALAGVGFDFSSPLAFIQSQIGGIGDSSATTLLKMEALGHVKFTDAQHSALEAVSAMDQWQAKIDAVNQSIEASQSKMSDWQNIIQLVSENVGTASNGYASLNELLQRGKITQQDYNDIKEAAIFLNERSKLGIEEEHVAIVKSLPDLAAFVNEHDIAVKKYDELDPAARGFADALSDAKNQAIIMTAVMVNLAHAIDPRNFPTSFVTTFVANVTQADPTIGALLDQLGLIPPEVKASIILDADQPLNTLDDVEKRQQEIRQSLIDLSNVPIDLQTEEQIQQAVALGNEYKRLDDLKVTIPIAVEGSEDVKATNSGIADTQDASESAGVAIADAFATAQGDIDNVGQSVAAVLPELIRVSSGVSDLSDPFAFLQKQVHQTGDSMAFMLLKAEQAGHISFSDSERSALRWQTRMDGVNAGLERLDGEIQNNESDMQMWQSRIDLVDNTIGDASNGYAELNQLVATGRLTQDQANDILEHAIHLRERSVGGILDERAELALSLIDLDNFVTAHDNLEGKYKTLTTEQKGFLAALKDEATQTALNTFLMLSFLEAMNKLPEGTADNFAKMTAANNSEVAAVFEELGILGEGADIPLTADTTDATGNIKKVKDDAAEGATLPINPVVTDSTGGPGTPAQLVPNQSFTVTADTSAAQTEVDNLTTHVQEQIAIALEYGTSEAEAYVDGWISGIDYRETDFVGALVVLETRLSTETDNFRTYGHYAGQSYDYGVAEGIYAYSSTVSAAASYLALLLHFSVMNALLSRSPSKKGEQAGLSYVQGIVRGFDSATKTATSKAASVAKSIHSAFTDEMLNARKIGTGDLIGGQPLGTTSGMKPLSSDPRVGNRTSVQHITVGDIHNSINGAGDPKAVAKEVTDTVWQELVGSFRRLESAVG